MKTDVCIIGAGPAGLTAGIFAAQAGAATVIVDSNSVAGRKLLHTGRGRCNLTHTGTAEELVRAYEPFGRFLQHSIYEFGPEKVRQYFAGQRLATKVEKDGQVFPITNRAADVKRVLVMHARVLNVRFVYGKRATGISRQSGGFAVQAGDEKVSCRCVIIATGGVTWGFTGSTGDGYEFGRRLGHKTVKPRACLVGLVTDQDWCGHLVGVGLEHICLQAKVGKKKMVTGGPLMFTENGVGGPAVFDLSRMITDYLPRASRPVKVTLDFLPTYTEEELEQEIIRLCSANPKKELAGAMVRFLPRSVLLSICKRLSPQGPMLAGQLDRASRRKLVEMLKRMPLSVKSTRPISEATVTRGGVATDQIDRQTMASKLCPGAFFAGEVINVDGPSGGYNLQICWSTGALAGRSAAQFCREQS